MLLFFCLFVFWPRGMWDLSSPTRDQTLTPCIGRWSLNCWAAWEVSRYLISKINLVCLEVTLRKMQTFSFNSCICFGSVQFSSVAQSCLILCDPKNRSTPGPPVHHQLLEFTQTRVHQVRDAIQPSHPRSSPSPPAPNPSQHQSLFQWVNSSHEVAKVLEFQLQHHSFQRNPRADLLQNGLVGSLTQENSGFGGDKLGVWD